MCSGATARNWLGGMWRNARRRWRSSMVGRRLCWSQRGCASTCIPRWCPQRSCWWCCLPARAPRCSLSSKATLTCTSSSAHVLAPPSRPAPTRPSLDSSCPHPTSSSPTSSAPSYLTCPTPPASTPRRLSRRRPLYTPSSKQPTTSTRRATIYWTYSIKKATTSRRNRFCRRVARTTINYYQNTL